jgi:hypothetical protein
MKILNTNAMSNAIKKVISLCGVDILADAFRFQAAIRDFMFSSTLKIEQQLLIFSIRIGIGEELLKAVNKQISEQKRIVTLSNALLTVEYGFQPSRSYSILEAFVSALGWDKSVIQSVVADIPNSNPLMKVNLKSESGQLVKGKVVAFGQYMWRVLYVKGNAALLLSDEITDIGIPYNKKYEETSWKESWLREWLNSEFIGRFSKAQQSKILKRTVRAENNQFYRTDAGVQTEDKVFLLSISEVVRNFGNSGQLKLKSANSWTDGTSPDDLSHSIDDIYNDKRQAKYKGERTWWWLRSPGESKSKAAYVNADGLILLNGELVADDGGTSCVGVRPGVRPAIWVQQ